MLTPDELKVVPDNIVKIYQDLEDDIISDIARRLQKAGEITDTADWQMYMLGQMGNDLEEIKSKIAKTNKMSKAELDKLFINATNRSMYYENIAYKKAGKKTLSLYDSPTMMKFVAANAKKTHGELKNLTKSLGFKSGDSFKSVAKTYQDTLNYAHFQVASGAFSYQDAVRNAVRVLTESGLRVVDYESGVSNMLDVAVRRATLTGINQTVAEMTLMQMKESDSEFVEVTAHMGARPDHQTWQGKVYHVGGDKDGYPDFEESTGYGTGAGLCGWNCRHSFFVFFPGISVRNYTDEQLKNIDPPPIEYDGKTYTYYEATQKQRQIERMIRKTKRELVALDSAGLKSDFTAKSVRLRKQKDLYVDFSKSAKLKTRNERNQVYGFNKSVGSKSSWANRKNIDKNKDIVDKTLNKGYNSVKETNYDIAVKKVLEHGKNTGNEGLMWLNVNGKEIIPFETGDSNSVAISQETMGYLMRLKRESVISLHNHPKSSSFSPADMSIACQLESVKEMRVIGHDGTKYFLEVGNGARPKFLKIDHEYAVAQNNLQPKYQQIFDKTKDAQATWKEQSHEINEHLANLFGWKYRRELP